MNTSILHGPPSLFLLGLGFPWFILDQTLPTTAGISSKPIPSQSENTLRMEPSKSLSLGSYFPSSPDLSAPHAVAWPLELWILHDAITCAWPSSDPPVLPSGLHLLSYHPGLATPDTLNLENSPLHSLPLFCPPTFCVCKGMWATETETRWVQREKGKWTGTGNGCLKSVLLTLKIKAWAWDLGSTVLSCQSSHGTLAAIMSPLGLPGGSVVKNPADARDMGSIPGSGRSPGEGSMGLQKSQTRLSIWAWYVST